MSISSYLLAFWLVWFFGGIFFFSWLRWGSLVRNTKLILEKTANIFKKSWQLAKIGAKEGAIAALLLAPFLIPIIVTVICLIAG